MGEEGILTTIKRFLFSNLNRQLMMFLFFLFLSAIFWLILTLNETYEKELKVPVKLYNIPKNVMLTSADVDTVRVTVRDKGWQMLAYMYGDNPPTLSFNFKNYDRGNNGGVIMASDVRRHMERQLEMTSKVTNVKPEKLEFFYNNGERKRVPVAWKGRVIPDHLYFISHVDYSSDSVDVYASREKLDSINVVYTELLNYVGFRDTLIIPCKLAHEVDVKVVPDNIAIRFYTDVLTEESIAVPIKCLNLPQGKLLRTFPAKVAVNFVSGIGEYKTLRPEDFEVVADYLEIEQKPSEKCNIYLRKAPPGITRTTLAAKQVDYLIEEEEVNR